MSGSVHKCTIIIFFESRLPCKKGGLGGIGRKSSSPESCGFTRSPRKDFLCAVRVGQHKSALAYGENQSTRRWRLCVSLDGPSGTPVPTENCFASGENQSVRRRRFF